MSAAASGPPRPGLSGRRVLLARLEAAVRAAAWGHRAVVCLVDLEPVQLVHPAAGIAGGDTALEAVGSALRGAVHETDTVALFGRDRFAVLADVSGSCSAEVLVERLCRAVSFAGSRSRLSVRMAEVEPGDDVAELLERAGAAVDRWTTALPCRPV